MSRPIALTVALLCIANVGIAQETAARAESGTSQKTFVYKQTPEAELELIVDFPADWKSQDQRPAIVFFFGGGWNNGKVSQFENQAAYLATRGMVAARADYRVKSRHNVTPDQCVEDAKSAIRWVREHAGELGVDPDRIVASGGSAGGHLAACTSLTKGLEAQGEDTSISSQPSALVLFNPALDIVAIANRPDEPESGSRFKSADVALQISPTQNLTKDAPPAILFFGTDDRLLEQGREYFARAKELGNNVSLKVTPDVGHGFFNRSPYQEQTLREADAFLVSLGYLEGEPTITIPEK